MSKNIVRSFFAIFSAKVGTLVLSIFITPLLARLLGSGGYGDYSFLLSMVQWLVILVYAGSFEGIRKYIAEDRSIEGWTDFVYGFYIRVVSSTALLIIIGLLVFADSDIMLTLLGEEFSLYFYFVALMIPFRVLFRTSRSALLGFDLESYSETLKVIDKLIFCLLVISFFYLGGGIAEILLSRTVAYAIVALIALGIVAQNVQLSNLLARAPASLPRKKLLTYGFSSMILSFLTVSLYHFDIILLRVLIGNNETGYYRAALAIAEFLWFVPVAIQVALIHSTSQLWVEEKYDQLTDIGTRATRYTLLFSVLLVLGIAGLARPLLTIYFGSEFEAAVIPLLLLLPGVLGFAVSRPVFAISQGQDSLRVLIHATAAAAVLNVILNLALIPRYGMNGAAVATSIAYGSMFIFHTRSARLLGFDPLADIRLYRIAATAAIASIPILGLPGYISSNIVSIGIVSFVGFLVYSVCALKTGAISEHEIQSLILNGVLPIERLVDVLPDRIKSTIKSHK